MAAHATGACGNVALPSTTPVRAGRGCRRASPGASHDPPPRARPRAGLPRPGLRPPRPHAGPHEAGGRRSPSRAAQAVDSAIAQAHLQRPAAHASTPRSTASPSAGSTTRTATPGTSAAATSRTTRGDPVVVDWRAPVSTPFYRATAADPMDLRRRRRFVMTGTAGRRPLRRGLRRPRQRRRRPPRRHPRPAARRAGALPHRRDARHRRHHRGRAGRRDPRAARHLPGRAGRAGHRQDRGRPPPRRLPALRAPGAARPARACWWSGPNPLFLRYIAQVLPSLGEAATRQTTVERLVGRPGARRRRRPERGPPEGRRRGMADGAARRRPASTCSVPARGPRRSARRGAACASRPPTSADGRRRDPRRATCPSPSVATPSAPGCAGSRGSATPTPGGEDAAPTAAFDAEMRTNAELQRRRRPGSGRRCRRRCS